MPSYSIDRPIVFRTTFFSSGVLGEAAIDELSAWKNYFRVARFWNSWISIVR